MTLEVLPAAAMEVTMVFEVEAPTMVQKIHAPTMVPGVQAPMTVPDLKGTDRRRWSYWQQQRQWRYVGTTDDDGCAGNGGVGGGISMLVTVVDLIT